MTEILKFLRELQENNNREWFNANKERYLVLKADFELFVSQLITKVGEFDEDIKGLDVKDCVYRIYRDARFSPDKTPYKTHFGAFLAARGGRHSRYGGYYLHIQPGGSLLAGGMYCPEPVLQKRLRQDVYDNIDEFTSIIRDSSFVKEFPLMEDEGKLKKVPAPFPVDFPEADLLKYRSYSVTGMKPDSFFETGDVLAKTAAAFRILYPFNRFLNYTVENL